jgi:hypothetical protein
MKLNCRRRAPADECITDVCSGNNMEMVRGSNQEVSRGIITSATDAEVSCVRSPTYR